MKLFACACLAAFCGCAYESDGTEYFSDSVEAGYQSEDPADLEIARKVRLVLANADRLSFEAEGVKVGAFDRVVTLSGDVLSTEEMRLIESLARSVAGVRGVQNEITVDGR